MSNHTSIFLKQLWNLRIIFLLYWALMISSIKLRWQYLQQVTIIWSAMNMDLFSIWGLQCVFWREVGNPCEEMHPFRYPGLEDIPWIWLIWYFCLGHRRSSEWFRNEGMRERGISITAEVSRIESTSIGGGGLQRSLCVLPRNILLFNTGRVTAVVADTIPSS